jgi:fatty acid desaturase
MDTLGSGIKSDLMNNEGISYLDFRKSLTPRYALVGLDIFLCYAALVTTVAIIAYLQKSFPAWFILTIPIGALFVGYLVQAIHLFIHEASHYNLAADKKQNDLLSNIFLGLLVGLDVEFFRTNHAAHHRYLGTVKDTEKSYFDGLTWRLVFESLTGIRALKVVLHRNKNVKLNSAAGKGNEIVKKNNRMFQIASLLNLLLVVAFFATGYWQVSLAWLIGFGAVFPFFASLRNILEHRTEEAQASINYNEVNQGFSNRMFGEGLIAQTMGTAGFNRHLLHHWDPQVSYTRLKEVEEFLTNSPLGAELKQSRTTYVKTFFTLLNR